MTNSAQRDYWRECVDIALEDAGIEATEEQKESVAGAFQGCHENYGMAFYSPPAGEHLLSEISDLERKLKRERNKVPCRECDGRGSITTPGPYHSSTSQCWKCRGEGRHDP
jgi:hypothetical protein